MPTKPPTFRNKAQLERIADRKRQARPETNKIYDGAWRRLRRHHLAANPLCVECFKLDKIVEATVVDHIQPVAIAPDRRLDPTNFRSCCQSCRSIMSQNWKANGINEVPNRRS
ncbi:HNH endonuclease [Belnapia sp. F-4-1]|uniref:HNH endonuclease n=1 Tax=Belnapia sp. F-4-1 TaxID=1545443 RepID=UPI0009DF68D3